MGEVRLQNWKYRLILKIYSQIKWTLYVGSVVLFLNFNWKVTKITLIIKISTREIISDTIWAQNNVKFV